MKYGKQQSKGFTLVEMLVVLAVIGLLAALLFPAFGRMQKRASMATCTAHLKQIGVAVRQYYLDEKMYPSSLTFLMPVSADLGGGVTNTKSTAFLSSMDLGKCPDDDTESTTPRLSYGQFGTTTPTALPSPLTTTNNNFDGGQYMWNYWGYRPDGYSYQTADEARTAQGGGPNYPLLLNPSLAYSHPTMSGYMNTPRNVVANSLSNRYAPPSTIITHCIYHRVGQSNLDKPTDLYYSATPTAGLGSRDLILFLDSSVKNLEVTNFPSSGPGGTSQWQQQRFP